jgi:putative inorganic carbon (HCO3(-)) transporter
VSIRGIILLVLLIPSIPLSFVRPFYGILAWTVIAFLNPQQFTWDAGAAPWALLIAIPTVCGFAIFNRDWSRLASRESVLMLALWIWFTFTTIVSVHTPLFEHHAADTWIRWQYVSKVLLMTLIIIGMVDSLARLRTLVLVIAGCLGIFVAKSIPFVILTGGASRLYGPARSMIGDNNDFGLALNMTLPLFYYLAHSESDRRLKRLFAALFLATIPAIFFTYSRGALVGLTAVMGLMLIRSRQRFLLIPVILGGFLIEMLFAPEAWKERMDPTRENVIDSSAESRINSWTFSWRLACDYPITGGGFATFTDELFSRYASVVNDVKGPHSIYFGVLAEHGFVGLFLYLALVVSSFASLRKVTLWARSQGDEIMGNYANMFRLSLIGFLTSGAFLGRMYFDYYFTIVACAVVLKRICALREAEGWHEDGEEEKDVATSEALELPAGSVDRQETFAIGKPTMFKAFDRGQSDRLLNQCPPEVFRRESGVTVWER